jgi:hypothetical protein
VNGRESTTGAFGAQHQQLLAERQVFEDKILARAEDDDDPTDHVPEEGDHGPRILSHSLKWETWKSFGSQVLEVLRRHRDQLPALQRSALNYGGRVGNGQVVFYVQLSSLLEALDVLRRQPDWEKS